MTEGCDNHPDVPAVYEHTYDDGPTVRYCQPCADERDLPESTR